MLHEGQQTISMQSNIGGQKYVLRFQALMAAITNMTALWDISPCSLLEVDRSVGYGYYFHHQPEVRQSPP
jgi:hypothetical protein